LLTNHRQRIHIAGVRLARPEVFVLKLELRIRKQSGLFPDTFSGGNTLKIGLQRRARLKRFVDGVLKAQLGLRTAGFGFKPNTAIEHKQVTSLFTNLPSHLRCKNLGGGRTAPGHTNAPVC